MTRTHITILGLLAAALNASAQFNSGSTGAYGPLNVTSNTALDLPADGIFNCTTITVATGATLLFNRNTNNTPVYLLATGDVNILGTIDVSGSNAVSFPHEPGRGGPGGFDGGWPGDGTLAPGNGYGPGGGGSGNNQNDVGSGSYSSQMSGGCSGSLYKGAVYGSPLLVPLVGGSGGGAVPGFGGGGGGGAILIASNTQITNNGSVIANGGEGYHAGNPTLHEASGSGGGIRLVAPSVSGAGSLFAAGPGGCGNDGRIRIDSIDRRYVAFSSTPSPSVGSYMVVFPASRIDLINVAGTSIPEGSGSVSIQLPNGSAPNQTVTVQASNFNTNNLVIQVVLTPQNGSALTYQTNLNNQANNRAIVTVPVIVPVSTPVTVSAWTKVP